MSQTIAWQSLKALGHLVLEIAASAILSRLEPNAFTSCYDVELPRVRRKILEARKGKLARFRDLVNRNAFLVGCGDYTANKPEEHLVIGYGFRCAPTTKVESIHHLIGLAHSVRLCDSVAHSMWDYYGQHQDNELLIFHNHPCSPLNFLLDNPPLPSQTDRLFLEIRGMQPQQLVRRLLGQGRVRFYLGENGEVKEFNLPSIVALIDRYATPTGRRDDVRSRPSATK